MRNNTTQNGDGQASQLPHPKPAGEPAAICEAPSAPPNESGDGYIQIAATTVTVNLESPSSLTTSTEKFSGGIRSQDSTSSDRHSERECFPVGSGRTPQPMSPLDAEDKAAVRRKSVKLTNVPPFTPSDLEDLSQELTIAWSQNRHKFNPAQGSMRALRKAFLERKSSKLVKKARAEKRTAPRVKSFSVPRLGKPVASVARAARDNRRPTHDGSQLTAQELVDLRLDVQQLLQALPPELEDLCERLKQKTLAEISRELGIPPSTLSSARAQIRQRIESSKFRDLL